MMIADDEFTPQKPNENNLRIFDDTIVIPLKVIMLYRYFLVLHYNHKLV
jgi:hypothetical protein